MGGFSLQDMQSWDKYGRKRTGGEQLQSVITGILKEQEKKREQEKEDWKFKRDQREGGYEPIEQEEGEGLAAVLRRSLKRMGGEGQMGDWQYTGQGQQKPVYVIDPITGELKKAGDVPKGATTYKGTRPYQSETTRRQDTITARNKQIEEMQRQAAIRILQESKPPKPVTEANIQYVMQQLMQQRETTVNTQLPTSQDSY